LDKNYNNKIGAQLKAMRNESLKWQEKFETNIGLDITFKRRLNFTFEYYRSMTNNALNPLTLVPSTGFSTVQENVGKVLNRGFDLRANYIVWENTKERSYINLSVMISRNKNTLKEISAAMKNYNDEVNSTFSTTSNNKRVSQKDILFFENYAAIFEKYTLL